MRTARGCGKSAVGSHLASRHVLFVAGAWKSTSSRSRISTSVATANLKVGITLDVDTKPSHCLFSSSVAFADSAPIVDDLPVVMSDLMVSSNPQSSSSRRVSSFGLKDLPTPPPLPNLDGMSRDVVSVCAMCTQCMRCVSPWRPMSRGSLQYSFGKFLELSFYNTSVAARDKVCTHNPRDHHVRFFGKAAALVAFKCVFSFGTIALGCCREPSLHVVVVQICAAECVQDFAASHDSLRQRVGWPSPCR